MAQGLRCIPVCFGEGNVEVSCTLRNILGNAEKLQGNKSLGHKTLNSFKLEATHPLEFGSTARLNVSAFQTDPCQLGQAQVWCARRQPPPPPMPPRSSLHERQRGVFVTVTDADSPHEVTCHAAWRTVLPEKDSFVW